MSSILWRYLAREIAVPSLLALVTITFILLLGQLNEMIGLLLQPSVSLGMILKPLRAFLPSLIIFATPMSILIGILVGVGRMTLDREILAIQASGVNVLRVFIPTVIIALAISCFVLFASSRMIPKLMREAMRSIADLQYEIVNSLSPGKMHSQLGGSDSNVLLFFNSRDPKTNEMLGITLKQQDTISPPAEEKRRIKEHELRAKAAEIECVAIEKLPDPIVDYRKTEQMLIFAERGLIEADVQRSEDDEDQAVLVLKLTNGSIHRLDHTDPDQEYSVVHFGPFERWQPIKMPKQKERVTLTNKDLRKVWNKENRGANTRYGALKTLTERYSIAWASLVFAFFGIPLAIWVKPTGKSWGIFVAICVMLVYYVLMKMGLAMIENQRNAGIYVAYLPNFLFAGLGAWLWWRTLTR